MSTPSSADVRRYWDAHIHDLDVTSHAPGTPGFFADLDAYHFEKLHHLLRLVDFDAWRGRTVLDAGCGAGVEVVRFARGGARVIGLDLSERAIELAAKNLTAQSLTAALVVGDAESLALASESVDFVYAHGLVQYAADDRRAVAECYRVLRPGGTAIFQVYNRISWLNALSKVMRTPLEHEDAPVLRRYSIPEFRALVAPFGKVEIIPERFPVKSRLHKGWKGAVYNAAFVGTFNALPRAWVRRFGWHLLAVCIK
ncbi:MAG TPA: class I SAM-dependent methyltransferase [Vicinamibacterales bacterium]|nr:class I SAM-dependent methyltransferase [Vicinamibacterales bacterium]